MVSYSENSSAMTTTSIPQRVRSNLTLIKPLRFYVPDNDHCVPYVFALSRYAISKAGDSETALLICYLSALCAVLPDVADIASKSMAQFGYRLQEIKLPSQAKEMRIYIPPSDDRRVEFMNFAQICYLPFQPNPPDSVMNNWLGKHLPASVGCSRRTPRLFASSQVAVLQKLFSVCAELCSCISSQVQSAATTSTIFGRALGEVIKIKSPNGYRCRVYKSC